MALTKISGSILKDPLNLGEVSIGGTLTYEDVTNVDSIGIITARSGIHIDDSITHIGDTNTKVRFPSNDTISLETNGNERLRVSSGGQFIFNHDAVGTAYNFNGPSADNNWGGYLKLHSNNGTTVRAEIRTSTSGMMFGYGGSERARIASNGKILIGSDTIRNVGGASASGQVQVEGTTANTSSLTLINNQADVKSPVLSFGKTRGTSTGAVTAVADGDNLGSIKFSGADGTDLANSTAEIKAVVNGTVAADQIPADLIFETSATNSSNKSEKLRITSGGQLLISGNTGWNESASLISLATDDSAAANMLSDSSAIYNHNNPAFIHVQNRYNTGNGQEAGIIFHSKSSFNGSWAIYGKKTTNNFLSDLIFRNRTASSTSAERLRIKSDGTIAIQQSVKINQNRTISIGNIDNFGQYNSSTQTGSGGSALLVDIANGATSPSYTTMVRLRGGAAGYVHASLNLAATSDDNANGNYRGLGIYMNDEAANNEWYAGRPYASSNQYMISYLGTVNSPYAASASTGYAKLMIQTNGNYNFSGSNTSDRDLKENITTLSETSLDKIIQLTPKTFNFKPQIYDTPEGYPSPPTTETPETKTGFIAQEVQSVIPSIVNGTDGQKDMGIDYNGLVAHMVNAIKEQQQQIEILKQENSALRIRVTNLEGE